MKIVNRKHLLSAVVAVAMAMTLWQPTTTRAEDETKPMKPMKGSEHPQMLNIIETKEDFDALKIDDTMAMVCAKCKTVWFARVKTGVKGAQLLMEGGQPKELIGTHACAGCKSVLTVVGVGKGAHNELKHSCGACGDESAFCCSTRPGSGATKGMKEEKK